MRMCTLGAAEEAEASAWTAAGGHTTRRALSVASSFNTAAQSPCVQAQETQSFLPLADAFGARRLPEALSRRRRGSRASRRSVRGGLERACGDTSRASAPPPGATGVPVLSAASQDATPGPARRKRPCGDGTGQLVQACLYSHLDTGSSRAEVENSLSYASHPVAQVERGCAFAHGLQRYRIVAESLRHTSLVELGA